MDEEGVYPWIHILTYVCTLDSEILFSLVFWKAFETQSNLVKMILSTYCTKVDIVNYVRTVLRVLARFGF